MVVYSLLIQIIVLFYYVIFLFPSEKRIMKDFILVSGLMGFLAVLITFLIFLFFGSFSMPILLGGSFIMGNVWGLFFKHCAKKNLKKFKKLIMRLFFLVLFITLILLAGKAFEIKDNLFY
ncbi:hypothetical protein COU58_02695 [Candidatus Pacearchaeota archaeon CG10_big_fil_rev_8_21_14_0_10_32_42]|nr:MAG: hypothetical protein COU58_02695 [Candidatus Pacearchaeota archaeon CG10_big_fil_rev_8_21_14_0_10_32_42]